MFLSSFHSPLCSLLGFLYRPFYDSTGSYKTADIHMLLSLNTHYEKHLKKKKKRKKKYIIDPLGEMKVAQTELINIRLGIHKYTNTWRGVSMEEMQREVSAMFFHYLHCNSLDQQRKRIPLRFEMHL